MQGLCAQPKPYQESLISVVHTTTFPTGRPFPKHIVIIRSDLSFRFYDEHYERSDHPVERKTIKIIDSTLCYIDKTDFFGLVSAFRKLDFDSLYVPKKEKEREDSIVMSKMGGAWYDYIIKTSMQTFTIGEGRGSDEIYSDDLQKFIWLIEDIEEKYKPGG